VFAFCGDALPLFLFLIYSSHVACQVHDFNATVAFGNFPRLALKIFLAKSISTLMSQFGMDAH
jgi:hypothetical protein